MNYSNYACINNIGFIHDFEAGWKTKAGEERFGLISAEIFELSGKNHLVYVWHDITERQKSADELKQKADEIKFMAYTDLLTNLPNKVALNQWMENELTQSLYFKKQGALMFIDFDDLKLINDTFGHSYGDAIIKLGGKRIAEVIENKGVIDVYYEKDTFTYEVRYYFNRELDESLTEKPKNKSFFQKIIDLFKNKFFL